MRTIRIRDLDERGVLAFDLKDIIAKLGPKVSRAFWNVSAIEDGLDVIGEFAAELEEGYPGPESASTAVASPSSSKECDRSSGVNSQAMKTRHHKIHGS